MKVKAIRRFRWDAQVRIGAGGRPGAFDGFCGRGTINKNLMNKECRPEHFPGSDSFSGGVAHSFADSHDRRFRAAAQMGWVVRHELFLPRGIRKPLWHSRQQRR